MVVIYIHGFGSSAFGVKSKLFKEYFKDDIFIAPSLSYIPILAIKTLEDMIESYIKLDQKVVLIGSSLGGFMATYLSDRYNIKAVLINPAIKANETLSRAIGEGISYFDCTKFEWNSQHLSMLKQHKVIPKDFDKFMVLLQTADELLDYKEAKEFFKSSKNLIIQEGGSHNFDNIELMFEDIEKFLKGDICNSK
jgi:predicted esterase YcpF (UPF0227 family)